MNRKGPWKGYRLQAKPVVSLSPLSLRAHFHRERDVWVRGRYNSIQVTIYGYWVRHITNEVRHNTNLVTIWGYRVRNNSVPVTIQHHRVRHNSIPGTIRRYTGKFDAINLMVRSNNSFVQYSPPFSRVRSTWSSATLVILNLPRGLLSLTSIQLSVFSGIHTYLHTYILYRIAPPWELFRHTYTK